MADKYMYGIQRKTWGLKVPEGERSVMDTYHNQLWCATNQ